MSDEAIAKEIAAVVRAHVDTRLAAFERDQAERNSKQLAESIPEPIKGEPGADGADGFGFDDLTVEHDGERSFTLRFSQGEREKTFSFDLPVVLDQGVYNADKTYSQGDAVSFGGSLWIARRNAPEGKPGQSDAWRLAVKKGRDGKR